MSELVTGEHGLERALESMDSAIVLFYASWCPFSRSFFPVFERFAEKWPVPLLRVLVDDQPELCEAYGVEVFPTVLFFRKGKVARRLDGSAGLGLDEKSLSEFMAACTVDS